MAAASASMVAPGRGRGPRRSSYQSKPMQQVLAPNNIQLASGLKGMKRPLPEEPGVETVLRQKLKAAPHETPQDTSQASRALHGVYSPG